MAQSPSRRNPFFVAAAGIMQQVLQLAEKLKFLSIRGGKWQNDKLDLESLR
jgi:hypothetical protein